MAEAPYREVEEAYYHVRGSSASTLGDRLGALAALRLPAHVRDQVERLLRADADPEFLSTGLPQLLLGHDPTPDDVGRVFGRFKAIRRIGQGGMGQVYLGERVDGVFEQAVAIKVLAPASDADAMRRFEHERRILARFEHPGIARLIDGGTDERGRPYLVMEYVDGVPIDEFCDEHGLDTLARATILERVCDAVAYAHRHLVIHRDLKPSNVLVGGTDAQPVVKVIDFGVALPGFMEENATLHQGAHRLLGTLTYMSPEQASPSHRGPADAGADVYSLGAVLYQLLTGRPPISTRDARLHEAIRRVIESEPARPSAIDRSLSGDIEAIMLKALEKDPTRRYQSAADLGGDLNRWRTGQPVLARRASVGYLFSKGLRRHRVPVVVGAIVAFALIVVFGTAHVFRTVLPDWSESELRLARLDLLTPRTQSLIYSPVFFNYSGDIEPGPQQPADSSRFDVALVHYERAAGFAFGSGRAGHERGVIAAANELFDVPVERWAAHGRPDAFDAESWVVVVAPDLEAAASAASPEALRDAGLLFLLTRHPRRSIVAMRRYEAIVVADPLLEGLLGELYLALEHPELAYPRLRAAYESFPDSRMVTVALAEAAVGVGDLPRAEALLVRASALPNADPYGRLTRVRALFHAARGEATEAETLFREASQVFAPGHPMRRLDDAVGNPVARLAYGRWLRAQGRHEEAVEVLAAAMFVEWLEDGQGARCPMAALAEYVTAVRVRTDMSNEATGGIRQPSLASAERHRRLVGLAIEELRRRPPRLALTEAEARRMASERASWR